MTEYAGSMNIEKADTDNSIYGATTELETQISRLGSILNDFEDKASRHITPQPALAIKIPSPPEEQGNTDAARRQWHNANDLRHLCNRLESLTYRLDVL